jgi:hypothetical protein
VLRLVNESAAKLLRAEAYGFSTGLNLMHEMHGEDDRAHQHDEQHHRRAQARAARGAPRLEIRGTVVAFPAASKPPSWAGRGHLTFEEVSGCAPVRAEPQRRSCAAVPQTRASRRAKLKKGRPLARAA